MSFSPQGIRDFGREIGITPIKLVIEEGIAADVKDAAFWLCERIGKSPESLGWRRSTKGAANSNNAGATPGPGALKPDEGPPVLAYMGLQVHVRRDRLDLAPDIEAAPVFPIEHMPKVLREMVEAVHLHTQAPLSLCAHSALSACALAAQPLADVLIPTTGSASPLSLFMLAVAVSGERKSTCDALVTRAVRAHEDALLEASESQRHTYEAQKASYVVEKKKVETNKDLAAVERIRQLQGLVEPVEPRPHLLRASEPTLEGLINLLKKGRPSVGVFSSEGGSFIGGHGMTDDAKIRTLTGLSRLWDDGSFDRVRAGEFIGMRGKRVSVSLAVQPRIAAKFMGDELAQSQGFLGRFLICFPDSTIGTREVRVTNPDDDIRVQTFSNRIGQLIRAGEECPNNVAPEPLVMSMTAATIHKRFGQAVEDELGKGKAYHPIQALAQRMPEHVARIAGVIHVFAVADHGLATSSGPISDEVMSVACEIGSFYLQEALRIGDGSVVDPGVQAAKDLQVWIEARSGDFISPRIIQQSAPYALRTNAAKTREMVAALCAAGVLEVAKAQMIDGKKYREVYKIMRGQNA